MQTSSSMPKTSATSQHAYVNFLKDAGSSIRKMMYWTEETVTERFVNHPYWPQRIILDGHSVNNQSRLTLVSSFVISAAIILVTTWFAVDQWRPTMPAKDKSIVLWFTFTGCLHIVFEGYFVLHHAHMPSRMDLLGQLWKEYALSDSRYLTQDTFVLAIESITALVWGPLSFWTAYLVATADPLRHVLQLTVSLAHIYGCLLYFATATVDFTVKHIHHSRPEFLYFWIYYFGMNFVFIVVPGLLLLQSASTIQSAFAALGRMEATIKANGRAARESRWEGPLVRKTSR